MLRKLSVGFVALSALGLGLGLPVAAVAADNHPDRTFAVANNQPGVGTGVFNVSANCSDPNQGGKPNSYATGGGCEFFDSNNNPVFAQYSSFPFFTAFPVIAGWQCIGRSVTNALITARAWAVCQLDHKEGQED